MEFLCPQCRKVIKLKVDIEGDLLVEAAVIFGVCNFCKSRVRCTQYASDDHKESVKSEVQLIADGNYIG